VKQGIQHGRLPIGDYIKMAARHVLTVNQVLEIMLRWLETSDWEKAFMAIIPQRKLPEGQLDKDAATDATGKGQEGGVSERDESESGYEQLEQFEQLNEDGNDSETWNRTVNDS